MSELKHKGTKEVVLHKKLTTTPDTNLNQGEVAR